jgi:hypothetical protein
VTIDSANGIISDCSLFQHRYISSSNENYDTDNTDNEVTFVKAVLLRVAGKLMTNLIWKSHMCVKGCHHFQTFNYDCTLGGTFLK